MKDDEEDDQDKGGKPTEFTSKSLSEIIQNFQYACDFTRRNDPINFVRGKKNHKFCAIGKLHSQIMKLSLSISKNLRIKVLKEIDFWLAVFNFYTRPTPYLRNNNAISTPNLLSES